MRFVKEQALLSAEGNNCMANRMEDKISTKSDIGDRPSDIGDRPSEDVAKGKCVGRELGVGNCILWGIGEGDLSGGMTVYRWVQNFLCVRLLTGNTNSKICIASEFCKLLVFACETEPVMLTH